MMVSRKECSIAANQGGTADRTYSSLTEIFCQGLFLWSFDFKEVAVSEMNESDGTGWCCGVLGNGRRGYGA